MDKRIQSMLRDLDYHFQELENGLQQLKSAVQRLHWSGMASPEVGRAAEQTELAVKNAKNDARALRDLLEMVSPPKNSDDGRVK
jgi:hypothetical protein